MKVSVDLSSEEVAALRMAAEERGETGSVAAHQLLRDALIGGGWLPLGNANRSRHAGSSRRSPAP